MNNIKQVVKIEMLLHLMFNVSSHIFHIPY